jgi:hypothetical protein
LRVDFVDLRMLNWRDQVSINEKATAQSGDRHPSHFSKARLALISVSGAIGADIFVHNTGTGCSGYSGSRNECRYCMAPARTLSFGGTAGQPNQARGYLQE